MKTMQNTKCIFSYLLLIITLSGIYSCQLKTNDAQAADDQTIQQYLDKNVLSPAFGGKVFSSHKIFLTEPDKIYLWAYMQEYYKKTDSIRYGTGWSVPLILHTTGKPGALIIQSHTAPMDGERYSMDIKNTYPLQIQNTVFQFPASTELKTMEKTAHQRALNYFQ